MTVIANPSDPFAAVRERAQKNADRKKAAADMNDARRRANSEARQSEIHRKMVDRGIDSMSQEFLYGVANYVTNDKMKPSRIDEIVAFAKLMLGMEDVDLPKLSAHGDAEAVVRQFGDTLRRVRRWKSAIVPEGYFFGERLFNQLVDADNLRKKQADECKKMRIVAGDKPRGPRQAGNTGRKVELAPAITPKPKPPRKSGKRR